MWISILERQTFSCFEIQLSKSIWKRSQNHYSGISWKCCSAGTIEKLDESTVYAEIKNNFEIMESNQISQKKNMSIWLVTKINIAR